MWQGGGLLWKGGGGQEVTKIDMWGIQIPWGYLGVRNLGKINIPPGRKKGICYALRYNDNVIVITSFSIRPTTLQLGPGCSSGTYLFCL
jgi:hypothetical protein